jgi:hypothetical protein
VGPKLNGTRQLLAYTDDVNLLGDNIGTLIDASMEVGLEIKVEKTKYILLSHHQNVAQNQDIKIVNRSLENMSEFKYLGAIVINQNLIQEKIKRRLNSGNSCYHSVQNILSYHLLSKNLKIIIYKTIILPGPPLCSSGQSSRLQIRRPGFDSRHYQEKKVVGLERGPPSLVSTTEELLDRKVAAPV